MMFLFNSALLIFFINSCINFEAPKFYRCGVNDENIKPILLKGKKLNNKTKNLYKRSLNSDGFKNFSIYLDTKNIENDIKINNLDSYHDLFINSMKNAINTIQSLLRVKPLVTEYQFTSKTLREDLNIKEWDKTKFGDTVQNGVTMNSLGIDLVIFGQIDTLGEGTLATASARINQISNGQPVLGIVTINKEVDYSKEKSQEYFQAIVFHEFTHILGFSMYAFQNFYHNIFTQNDQFGIMRTYINSAKVLEVARKYFNCTDLEGVELEESGGDGTAGSHWEARILLGDYMNGYAYTEEMVISEFTLALLEDTGYYKPNYYTGGLMRFGKNKGCEFVRGKCVDKDTHKINPLFYNEFFDNINSDSMIDPSCSPGRQSRTYSAFWHYSDIPEEYQYFESNDVGGYSPADYCPIAIKYSEEEEKTNFAGHCSKKGSGEYGSKIVYSSNYISPLSKNMIPVTGETLSDHSFCFLSSLTKNSLQISNIYSSVVRAVCYEIFCSSESLTVKIHEDYIVCPREGGKIMVDGYDGYFLCPDYYLMCSGTVICNDLFDCVDKKSETKESSYKIEYTPKTSQNIDEANDLPPDKETNFELSDDGICPQNCRQCKEKNKCFKCREGYGLEGFISENKTICTNVSELVDKYYVDNNNIHYKCIDNCEICSNYTGCDTCLRGYALIENQCIKTENIIINCHDYDQNETCVKCNKDYAFFGDNKNICVNKENFGNYYSMDGGISYYPCDLNNTNCSKCYYDYEANKMKCTLCKNDLILFSDEKGEKCLNKSLFVNDSTYVIINKTHVELCEKVIPYCEECENNKKCKKCRENYYFNNYDNKCLFKENTTQNYPINNKNDETNGSDVDNNKNSNNNQNKTNLNSGNCLSFISNIHVIIVVLLILL